MDMISKISARSRSHALKDHVGRGHARWTNYASGAGTALFEDSESPLTVRSNVAIIKPCEVHASWISLLLDQVNLWKLRKNILWCLSNIYIFLSTPGVFLSTWISINYLTPCHNHSNYIIYIQGIYIYIIWSIHKVHFLNLYDHISALKHRCKSTNRNLSFSFSFINQDHLNSSRESAGWFPYIIPLNNILFAFLGIWTLNLFKDLA